MTCQKILHFKIFKKIENQYLLKILEISWLLTNNLKESYNHLLYKFYNIISFIKNNLMNDFRVEISLMPKWKIFWFQKSFIQTLWIFRCNICILVTLCVKVFVLQGLVQAEIAVHTLQFSVNLINCRTLSIVLLVLPIPIDVKQVKQQ